MSSTFTGFSEEDLKRIKSGVSDTHSAPQINTTVKRIDKIGVKPKRPINPYKLPALEKPESESAKQDSDESLNNIFDKCRLSIKTPTTPTDNLIAKNNDNMKENNTVDVTVDNNKNEIIDRSNEKEVASQDPSGDTRKMSTNSIELRKHSTNSTPDIVRCVDNYTEDELAAHKTKMAELQLKQKLMEEQNKKRKEMLAKALADRTKQTAEEVLKLEKIKKELQVLDGQFSQDVGVLRKKIDHACLGYAEAEKHYLKVEKEFLQAKINLQKEKENKELLTEHLCTLITHNEARKATKLENLMLELATDKKAELNDVTIDDDEEGSEIVDGVDQKTGKIVEFTQS